MKSERTVIILVAAILLVLCSAASCLVGLAAGGVLALLPVRQQTRANEWWFEVTPDARRAPQRMRTAAMVTQVVDGSPADEAGIEVGNMILALEDRGFESGQDLRDILSRYEPGDEVTLLIWDRSVEREVEVTLGERPDDSTAPYLGIEYRMTMHPF